MQHVCPLACYRHFACIATALVRSLSCQLACYRHFLLRACNANRTCPRSLPPFVCRQHVPEDGAGLPRGGVFAGAADNQLLGPAPGEPQGGAPPAAASAAKQVRSHGSQGQGLGGSDGGIKWRGVQAIPRRQGPSGKIKIGSPPSCSVATRRAGCQEGCKAAQAERQEAACAAPGARGL